MVLGFAAEEQVMSFMICSSLYIMAGISRSLIFAVYTMQVRKFSMEWTNIDEARSSWYDLAVARRKICLALFRKQFD